MKFDASKYMATNFRDRVKSVPVPTLSKYFVSEETDKEKKDCVWLVRGLTGTESAIARQAVVDSKNLEAVLESLGTGRLKEKVTAIRKIAGLMEDDEVPEDLVRRYSWLTQGSVDPICDQSLAIKLAENHAEEFYLLTNTIIQLTSLGRLGE